ncbi:hypothetical protein G9A89_008542 [Geosiphon pyriformis]|nr:hypothetical protein G9A89_008542 [Geosiphon pyriformis]
MQSRDVVENEVTLEQLSPRGKMDPNLARDDFAGCWPVKTAGESRQFRQVAFKRLEQLKKEGLLGSNDLVLRRSFFDECQGDRFDPIIMAFSNYVLKYILERDYHSHAQVILLDQEALRKISPQILKSILKMHVKMQTEKFIKATRDRKESQDRWKKMADQLIDRLRLVTGQSNDLERERCEFYRNRNLFEKHDTMSIEQLCSLRRQKLETIRFFWNACVSWITENNKLIESVEDILHGRANKHRLDGNNPRCDIPNILMKLWEKEFEQQRIIPYHRGKLDLRSLLKIWRLTIQTLNDIFARANLPENDYWTLFDSSIVEKTPYQSFDIIQSLHRCVAEQRSQVQSIFSLHDSLHARLKEINESIRQLKDEQRLAEDDQSYKALSPVKYLSIHWPSFSFQEQIDQGDESDLEMVELNLATVRKLVSSSTCTTKTITREKKEPNEHDVKRIPTESISSSKGFINTTSSSSASKLSLSKVSRHHVPPIGTFGNRSRFYSIPKPDTLPLKIDFNTPVQTPRVMNSAVYDVISDQIIDFMTNEDSENHFSTPQDKVISNYEGDIKGLESAHIIRDPIDALGEQAFKPLKEIQRTPVKKGPSPTTIVKSALKTKSRSPQFSVKFAATDTPSKIPSNLPIIDESLKIKGDMMNLDWDSAGSTDDHNL